MEKGKTLDPWGFPCGSAGKESACNAGDLGSISGLGRFPREGNGNPLQYSCLENPMDEEAWWATVHGVFLLSLFRPQIRPMFGLLFLASISF